LPPFGDCRGLCRLLLRPPLDGAAQAGLEVGPRPEAELLLGPADVQAAAGLPIWLARIPFDLPLVADQLAEDRDEALDRDLTVGTEVDRLAPLVALGRQPDRLRRVVNIEKLAAGREVAPDLDGFLAGLLGREDLADQGRNDVRGARIEVIAGSIEVDREQVDGAEAIRSLPRGGGACAR
jgi:hypothetical protein